MTELQKINKHIEIKETKDQSFKRYGTVLDVDAREMVSILENKNVPKGYCMSDPALEDTEIFAYFRDGFYGGMPIQAGICVGDNTKLNCFEYHRGTEINIAVTDMVLLLAHTGDLKENRIESGLAQAFYIPKGMVVALFETTMHFAPLSVYKDGFACAVLLPRGTNGKLEGRFEPRTVEDRLLFKRNKWLVGHPESAQVSSGHAFCGIVGENISLTPLEGNT